MSENTAKTAAEWVFVAKSVAQLPDGENPALRCMAYANMAAQDMGDWLAVAKAWAQDLGDIKMGRQCMANAEDIAGYSEEIDNWLKIAKIWKEDFQDLDCVTRCMEVIEGTAEDIDDWVRIAKICKDDFQDIEKAIRCMEIAEAIADDFEDYSTLEETWRVDFQDVDRDIVNSAIQRLVGAADADAEGYFDGVMEFLIGGASKEQIVIVDLGILPPSAIVHQDGTWSSECNSDRREGSYARYFIFTIPMPMSVTIDVISSVDTYLYLVKGSDLDGDVLDENDDWQDGANSHISRHLAAGTYTIEATTYKEEETSDFTLAINT